MFKLAGKIIDVELYRDRDGKSRGCAVIDFDHPVESVQAISMFHDQRLYDRQMTVRMDRIEALDMPLRLPEGLQGIGMGLGPNGEPLKNVSQHLQSIHSTVSDMNTGSNSGPGILGAVPTPALQNLGSAAAALSNVVNTPALANLASASAALGLTGVQNQLLAGNLNELGLGNLNTSLVSNSFGGGGNALSNLTSTNLSNMSSTANLSSGNMMGQNSFGRGDSTSMFHSGSGQGTNREYSSGSRDYETSGRNNYDNENDYRDDFRQQNNSLYSTANNGAQRRDSNTMDNRRGSDTVVVTNVSLF